MHRDWGELPKWAQQDLGGMIESRQTIFVRCNECNRIHDKGYCCPHCGHDNSEEV